MFTKLPKYAAQRYQTKNSGAFAKQCLNDMSIIIQSDVVVSFYKLKVKQYLLDKVLAKYFAE